MLDLTTYRPRGDKRNTSFFEHHLPLVYERRARSGLDQLVGTMAALVIQVDHGHALAYMAELALMGPYRFRECWLIETHRLFLLEADPAYPRLILLEPLSQDFEDQVSRWNSMYPLSAAKPNARYIGEIFHTGSVLETRRILEQQCIRFVDPGDTVSPFYSLPHLAFTFLSDYTYNRVGYVEVPLDSLAALEPGDRVLLDDDALAVLQQSAEAHQETRPEGQGVGSGSPGHPGAGRRTGGFHPGVSHHGALLLLGGL
jgi:hypothetical protein